MLFKSRLRPPATEPWMTDLLRQLLPTRAGLFIDVGVNLGQTLVKVKDIDPERSYLGFEPNPACVALTERMIPALGLRNCRIVPAGLSLETGVVELAMISASQTAPDGSIVRGFRSNAQVVARKNVVVLGFDDLPADLFNEPAAFLKIDVEGGELEVVQALQPIIDRDLPIILIEILPCYSADKTERISRQEQTEALLRDRGYRLERVIKHGSRFGELQPIESIGIHDDLAMCDYVAVPPS
jgi:FkbM family methyltransferase